jgi:branched-chain amino acid transport system substrate-binding protein
MKNITRRAAIASAAAGSLFARPVRASGEPINIGMPLALTGALGLVGEQMRRGATLWAKQVNAKGGILGRPVKLFISDTGGDPAACVRKAQEAVERDGCHLLFGMTLSSEALAVVPKLAEWKAIFISGDNGDGRLTGESFVPNFFRPNISGPMGARAVSLYLRQAPFKKFFGLGMDYAWGRNSVAVFETETKRAGKEFVGAVFSPTGTKDFSPYITKIRNSGADAMYFALAGDDLTAFLSQAKQYRLSERLQIMTEVVDMAAVHAVGDAAVGMIGSTRYSYAIDTPANKTFVAAWKAEYGTLPDNNEGDQYQSCQVLQLGIEAAGTTDIDPLRAALEKVAFDGIKGHAAMRACDHQLIQPGFIVRIEQGKDGPEPKVIATFPGERTAPACRQMDYTD